MAPIFHKSLNHWKANELHFPCCEYDKRWRNECSVNYLRFDRNTRNEHVLHKTRTTCSKVHRESIDMTKTLLLFFYYSHTCERMYKMQMYGCVPPNDVLCVWVQPNHLANQKLFLYWKVLFNMARADFESGQNDHR